MKIDAHQHFWHYDPPTYPWIQPGMDALQRDYLPEDLAPLLAAEGISGSVAVRARQSLEETRWLLALAERHPFIKGVVGAVDFCGPGLREQLDHFAMHPTFCGVRHMIHDERGGRPTLCDGVIQGMTILSEYDLTFDLLILPEQLSLACELARRFPAQRFVLNHIGGPPIKTSRLAPWDAAIKRLGALSNVYCKASGMITAAGQKAWRVIDFRPYLDVVFEAFGAGRVMFGSNWPVSNMAGTYADVVGIVRDYVGGLSEVEQVRVWGETAVEFYGLERGPSHTHVVYESSSRHKRDGHRAGREQR